MNDLQLKRNGGGRTRRTSGTRYLLTHRDSEIEEPYFGNDDEIQARLAPHTSAGPARTLYKDPCRLCLPAVNNLDTNIEDKDRIMVKMDCP